MGFHAEFQCRKTVPDGQWTKIPSEKPRRGIEAQISGKTALSRFEKKSQLR
jgi:hypothetical protein